ncbi:ABC transporter ATP-binding protein [Desulfosporosinus meridiei]|uniref:Oligopeptide/dipeptide ABC transporter, ATP-binding protein n=1 Tax=Desulfosporosinus meridiei (strain ATCC BAA-275 / DSM 13257 / KCTC 12902 / NCIMB 13706 / S10) TaxID=768704 RepID=J7J0R0_DESMD|nr:oligopeptide/dipeptide ABC transporter ATP-binding protein [Desulfosporosinus meridiei]AFQ44551.1 oligopeptide/dipeptide ABC transporter, ATP-binding protein [Desulfosporosinus meridiei DSM 13257]
MIGANKAAETLLKVENLKKYFPIKKGLIIQRHVGDVKAVDGVSFEIYPGETLGMVGESGCGKSTLGRTILRLLEPTKGKVIFDGQTLNELSREEMRKIRSQMQMIFQDPLASLNPRMRVRDIIGEPIVIHEVLSRVEREKRVSKLLDVVGLNTHHGERYPYEFSGGQRQRIGIARALAVNPKLIICDEPVSALDVSIQAQVINLLEDLQAEFNLTYLLIAHDLAMVKHLSNRIAVMYLGKLVELTSSEELFLNPRHPYTIALLSVIPLPYPHQKKGRIILKGDTPSPVNLPSGCRFHTRCPNTQDICKVMDPELIDIGNKHFVACHLTINTYEKIKVGNSVTNHQ